MKRHRAGQGGYTLLEVVVAFAILTLSLGALFESFSMTLRRSEKARNLSRAELLAESVRDRLGIDLPLNPPGSEGQEQDCRWQLQLQPIPRQLADRPPSAIAIQVGIDVTCGNAGGLGSARLDTVELVKAQ